MKQLNHTQALRLEIDALQIWYEKTSFLGDANSKIIQTPLALQQSKGLSIFA